MRNTVQFFYAVVLSALIFSGCANEVLDVGKEDLELYRMNINRINKRWMSAYTILQETGNYQTNINLFNLEAIENFVLPKFFHIKGSLENLQIENKRLASVNQIYIETCTYHIHFFENIRDYLKSEKTDNKKLEYAITYLQEAEESYAQYKKSFGEINQYLKSGE